MGFSHPGDRLYFEGAPTFPAALNLLLAAVQAEQDWHRRRGAPVCEELHALAEAAKLAADVYLAHLAGMERAVVLELLALGRRRAALAGPLKSICEALETKDYGRLAAL